MVLKKQYDNKTLHLDVCLVIVRTAGTDYNARRLPYGLRS